MSDVYRGGEPLAEVVRSNFVEGFHRGSAVVLGPDGQVKSRIGDIDAPVFPRSANKPMQSVAALRSGWNCHDDRDLAIASASHRGEPFHVARARKILLNAGLTAADLQTPVEYPIDPEARDTVVAAGGGPTRLLMNCSGKHAAMLATCVDAGWSTHDYLDPDHPLQKANRQAITDLSGYDIAATGVDGCGAPLFAFPLLGLAQAFLRLVSAESGTLERRVADAMRTHPQFVSGTRGADTRIMRAVPGALAKGGAEGIAAIAVLGVGAIAVKIDDGALRAATPVSVAALQHLLARGDRLNGVDELALTDMSTWPLLGGGEPVGEVRPLWPTD
ncbi:asparaginase [Stackebrandtia endophytica]|uniref:Asparaginase n=1 Tax=Stackebrandtia endophytica TaxID=1496996 RepID=A0A543AWK6_9ACTN|nr:asparaginase [Stackebrandtia endophytica]TQL76939.1 asparaginase [Stackebrandtia endophytica]